MAKHQAAQTRTTTTWRASSENLTHFCNHISFLSSCFVCKLSTSLPAVRLVCVSWKKGDIFFVKSSRPHNCNKATAARMNEWINLYSAFSIATFKCAFTSQLSEGEIGHQHIQAPLAAAISPLAISTSTWMKWDLTTTPGTPCPTLYE